MPPKRYTAAQKAAYAKRMAAARKRQAIVYKAPARKQPAKRRTYTKRANSSAGIGEQIGSSLGAVIGRGAQALFKSVTGFGDYSIRGNTLLQGGMSPPMIVNSTNKGGVIVRHREYLQDIDATIAFTNLAFPINPGIAGTFPWLSQVAESFEQYKFRGLIFEFKSLSSDAVLSTATSSALGAVIMATDYNVLNPAFPDKMHMENYEFANSSKPSCDFLHPVECERSQTPVDLLYIRNDSLPTNADQRLYDLGSFQIATVGMQASAGGIGELWCTYEVEFYKNKLNAIPFVPASDHYRIDAGTSGAVPLGTSRTILSGELGTFITDNTTINFPADTGIGDQFFVSYANSSASTVSIVAPSITGLNMEVVENWANGALPVANGASTGSTNGNLVMNFYVKAGAAGPYAVAFGVGGTVPNASILKDIIVSRLPSTFV